MEPALRSLQVNGYLPLAGYSASAFGPVWADDTAAPLSHNGCPTDQDILRRDLTAVVLADDCSVGSGTLNDPYTGQQISYRSSTTPPAVTIGRIVELQEAWRTGAQQWTAAQRATFANDPLNLLAAEAASVATKATGSNIWDPVDYNFLCDFTSRQIAVKAKYRLWVTPREEQFIGLSTNLCRSQVLPAEPAKVSPPARMQYPTVPTPSSS